LMAASIRRVAWLRYLAMAACSEEGGTGIGIRLKSEKFKFCLSPEPKPYMALL
jgi:hypothetical protein